jgi:hypothetical protein
MEIEYLGANRISINDTSQCTDCGALVSDQAQHSQWHFDLVRAFDSTMDAIVRVSNEHQ